MRPLSGWKEIAAHLHQGVRTVQRWERLGLPIHRIQPAHSAQVVAFAEEVEAWEQGAPVESLHIVAELEARVEALETELAILKVHVRQKAA